MLLQAHLQLLFQRHKVFGYKRACKANPMKKRNFLKCPTARQKENERQKY